MRTIGTKTHLRSLMLAFLLILAYFGVWRQVRVIITTELVFPIVEFLAKENLDLTINIQSRPAITIKQVNQVGYHEFSGFGNSFFLFGSIYFVLVGYGLKPVSTLFLIHQGITILALLCLLLAVSISHTWLYPMKLLVTYITPAATGMFVLMQKRLTV